MSPRWFANESIFRTKDFVDRAASLCSAARKLEYCPGSCRCGAGAGNMQAVTVSSQLHRPVTPSQAQAAGARASVTATVS